MDVPPDLIDTINKVVRISQHMLPELGREPSPEEVAEKLAVPLGKVLKVLEIAKRPIRLPGVSP
jgi:RNA polymerase primary sigma factor